MHIKNLHTHLANLIDVELQSRQAHWNVKGENFGPLHALFGEVYSTLSAQVDTVGERLVQLGEVAAGSATFVGRLSEITDYPPSYTKGTALCQHLAIRLKIVSTDCAELFKDATKENDHVTADIMLGLAAELDKLIWKLKASE